MKLAVDTEIYINDLIHFYNHVNYLFRTDKAQKWTTEKTLTNKYLISGRETLTSFYVNKEVIKMEVLNNVRKLAKQENSVFEKNTFINRIGYFCVYGFESYNNIVDLPVNEIEEIITFIITSLRREENISFICAVNHNDQKCGHIHFLYYYKKKTKKIPLIELIHNGYDECKDW